MAQDRQGKWLAIPTADKVAVFDARTGELVRTLTGHTGRVYTIAFSPDGKSLAAGNWAGAGKVSTIKSWNLKTGAMTGTLDSFVGDLFGVNFSGDGKHFFSSGPGGVQMWDLTSGRSVKTFKSSGNTSVLCHVALSPDGKRVVCHDTPETVKVWEIEEDNPPLTLGGHTSHPQYAAYSSDGNWLATGSLNELLLWDAATLELVKKITTPANWLAFASDGKSLLTAPHWDRPLKDEVVTRWDLATYEGKPLPPLTGRTGWPVYHLSPDGNRLYSQVVDGPGTEQRVRVYDAATGADVEAFSLQALAKRFPALLRGEDKPADNAERLDFAQVAFDQKQFAFATRLWAEALANDPKLSDDLTPHRYNAARAAALAAAGQGKDEPPLDDVAKAKLRQQALSWLKAEFTDWSKVQPPQPFVARPLWQWQQDSDLAGIRDQAALAKLPPEEQKAFTQFWADAAELYTKAGGFRALPAAEQVEEVRNELKKRNPGSDGSLTYKIEDGVVTELNINDKNVTDHSPVRFLVGLKVFGCTNGPLSDLSPLKGLPLTSLDLHGTQVRDLTPLKDMPLTSLHLWWCSEIRDLGPLKGMKLIHLDLNACKEVKDLEPLQGMPLTTLYINGSQVRDLTPLKDMKLTFLACNNTAVSDLSPLKGMPLTRLLIYETGVADLKPLQGMPLEDIRLTPKNITQGLDILRDMNSLKSIGLGWFDTPTWPAAEFWARYAKGEFKK